MSSRKDLLTDGEKIYACRRACELSQGELARYLRFHQTAISKMERGDLPVHPRVKGWMDTVGYNVPLNVLLTIYRKRAGLYVKQAGRLYGCGAWRVTEMEAGRGKDRDKQAYFEWLNKQLEKK